MFMQLFIIHKISNNLCMGRLLLLYVVALTQFVVGSAGANVIFKTTTGEILTSQYCEPYITRYEASYAIPDKLLHAIALVESGKKDKNSAKIVAWPWAVNVAGSAYFFNNKQEAIMAVERARKRGIKSIDVGCMQVNLLHHPHAFKDLDTAFDPASNVKYAAEFLAQQYRKYLSWQDAAGAYHSATPIFHDVYKKRVMNVWLNKRPLMTNSAGDNVARPRFSMGKKNREARHSPLFIKVTTVASVDKRKNAARVTDITNKVLQF
jgi:hypothetical protein